MVTDTFNMAMHPLDTLEATDYADQHRIETAIYAGAAIYASWKRDIVNGKKQWIIGKRRWVIKKEIINNGNVNKYLVL